MLLDNEMSLDSEFGTFSLGREENRVARLDIYKQAVLTNPVTGKRKEEVLLLDFQNEDVESALLGSDDNPELREDIRRALSGFSQVQKRLLFRVLVQGQSVRSATRRWKNTSKQWERWFYQQALPALRKSLVAYAGEVLKKSAFVPTTPAEEVEENAPRVKFKCKLCDKSVLSRTERSGIKALRNHCAKRHPEHFKSLQRALRECDETILRERIILREPKNVSVEEDENEL